MEILIILAVVIAAVALYVYKRNKSWDLNNDGKVDQADAKEAVEQVKTAVKKTAQKARAKKTPAAK
jgi:sensor domain CHASE-containing protein